MPTLERTVERRTYHLPKYVAWGSILGGLFVALATMGVLAALGIAVGASSIDPVGDSPTAKELGVGTGIWWLISGILALFAGGVTTARLSNLRRKSETSLHGLVVWGIYSVIALLFTTSVVGSLLAGTGQFLSSDMHARSKVEKFAREAVQDESSEVTADPHTGMPAVTDPAKADFKRHTDLMERRQMAQDTVDALSMASWWSFAYLLLTAIAAAAGCMIGAQRERDNEPKPRITSMETPIPPPPVA